MVFVLLVFALSLALAQRQIVNFNYGWRFMRSEDPSVASNPVCTPFKPLPVGSDCIEIEHNPNRFSAADCETACCLSPNCHVWTWNNSVIPRCFHGGAKAVCTRDNFTTVGGSRKTARVRNTNFTFSSQSFDDSLWEIVDTPHDSLINQSYAANADHLHGHLPRKVSFYRKHFHLLEEWRNSTVVITTTSQT